MKIWGSERVGIRLSPVTPDAGNTPSDSQVMDLYGHLIEQLNRFHLAYLHFVEGATATSREVPAGVDMDALSSVPFGLCGSSLMSRNIFGEPL